jgi:NAD-dependent dihydropyrimidine dehydrogenase PreA subunit
LDTKSLIKPKQIHFCNCKGERISAEILSGIEEHLKKMPVQVTRLSDLCGLVSLKKDQLSGLFADGVEYMVIGCYERTMSLLLEQVNHGAFKPASVRYINLITSSQAEIIRQVDEFCSGQETMNAYNEIHEDSGWPSWFPVIDYSRCTACGQCADFCLFGVYEKTIDNVKVINPQGCKNKCPACGRICPSTAIIFPKYENGGAISGSDEIDEHAEQQRQAMDIQKFLGDDLYSALQQRKVKRQSIIRDEAMKNALAEREKALKENHKNET